MSHFTAQDWFEFVTGAAPANKQNAMHGHLNTDCENCHKTADWWRRVSRAASALLGNFSLASILEGTPALVELLLDTFTEPRLSGTRSGLQASRQLLYQAGPYQIDLQIEPVPETNSFAVTGQLLDTRQEFFSHGIPVSLRDGRGHVVLLQTNEFGEFLGEVKFNGKLEISFQCPGERSVVIALRGPLGRTSGDTG